MTNERILSYISFKGGAVVFRETCVLQRGFVACSPAGVLRSRCSCCGDGRRVLARTNVRGTRAAMWIHKSRRAVARASRKLRQPSQGSGEHSCGFEGAGVCN